MTCTRCPRNFSTQRGSEQKSNAGNALGEDVRIIGQKDIAKTHGITATEYIIMEGIAGNPQGSVRTRLITQMKVKMEGWVGQVTVHVCKIR